MMRTVEIAIGGLRRLNPFSLISGHLLKSWPSVWRTRIVHVSWWSLVAYCGLYIAGMQIPTDVKSISSVATLDFYAATISLAVATVMSYWLILVWQTPLANLRTPVLSATLLMYLACIYVAAVVPVGFNKALVARIAPEIIDVEADYASLMKYNFGDCFQGREMNEEVKELFTTIPPKYGLTGADFNCASHSYRCPEETPLCVILRTQDGKETGITLLQDRILFSKAIKDYSDGKKNNPHPKILGQLTSAISAKASFLDEERLFVCFLASLMLLTLHVTKTPTEPVRTNSEVGIRGFIPSPRRLLTRRLDLFGRYLLVNYPNLWATRFHVLIVYNILIISISLGAFSALAAIDYYFDVIGAQMSYPIVVAAIFTLPPVLSSLLQIHRPTPMTDKRQHIYFSSSLMLNFLPLILLFLLVGSPILYRHDGNDYLAFLPLAATILSTTIFIVGNIHYLYIIHGYRHLISYFIFCIFNSYALFITVDYSELILCSCFVALVIFLCLHIKRSIAHSVAFSLYTSLISIASIFGLLVFFAHFIDFDSASSDNRGIVIHSFISVFFPFVAQISILRRVYTASHSVYMSPSSG